MENLKHFHYTWHYMVEVVHVIPIEVLVYASWNGMTPGLLTLKVSVSAVDYAIQSWSQKLQL